MQNPDWGGADAPPQFYSGALFCKASKEFLLNDMQGKGRKSLFCNRKIYGVLKLSLPYKIIDKNESTAERP